MKVVFCDVDGVINTYSNNNASHKNVKFDAAPCQNLEDLLKEVPDLQIVVSSAWRHKGLEKCKEIFKNNGIDPSKVIGITGNESGDRGHQIQAWLDKNPEVKEFVIIDDNTDMGSLMDKLVKTNSYVGLTTDDVKKAVKILDSQK